MKRIALVPLLCLFIVSIIVPVHASITIEALANGRFQVSFDFGNLNSTIYAEIKAHPGIFNGTSIPRAIVKNLEKQNLKQVSWNQTSTSIFNDTEQTINVKFYLEGQDIATYTLNKTTLIRTFSVKTNWIRFDVKLTNTFVLNFTTYFTKPISDWQRTNHTVSGNVHTAFYYHSSFGASPFDASCYFVLPLEATNIKATGDTLTFDVPPIMEDKLLDSPILILGAIITANIVFVAYRKFRK